MGGHFVITVLDNKQTPERVQTNNKTLYRLNWPGQRLVTDQKVRGSRPGGGHAASYTLGTGSVIPEGKEAEVTDRVETYPLRLQGRL